RHTRFDCDWSSDVCSSDLVHVKNIADRNVRRLAQLRSQGPDADLNAEVPVGAPQPGIPRPGTAHVAAATAAFPEGAISTNVGGRSEERRVGKESRSRGARE